MFPPVSADSPLARQFEPAALTTAGALYSFTTIHPSAKSGLSPYSVGYVDFEEDAGRVRLFGRLLGSDVPSIGDRFEPVPDEKLGYAFQPASA
ncbi:OB-fold domain-containing protein [Roseateles sp. P5_E11]